MESIQKTKKSASNENAEATKIAICSRTQAFESWRLGEVHLQWWVYKMFVPCPKQTRRCCVGVPARRGTRRHLCQIKCQSHGMGAMGVNGLSKLHIVPAGETVNANYYVTNILQKELKPALKRQKKTQWKNRRTKVGSVPGTHNVRSRWCDTSHCSCDTGMVYR